MQQYIAKEMDVEIGNEIQSRAEGQEIFKIMSRDWDQRLKTSFASMKKRLTDEDTCHESTPPEMFGWFRTIAIKYYVHIAVKPTLDAALDEESGMITCFTITAIDVFPRNIGGLYFLLSTIELFFDRFRVLVDYYKLEGVSNRRIIQSLLKKGWRRRSDKLRFDTTLYLKVA